MILLPLTTQKGNLIMIFNNQEMVRMVIATKVIYFVIVILCIYQILCTGIYKCFLSFTVRSKYQEHWNLNSCHLVNYWDQLGLRCWVDNYQNIYIRRMYLECAYIFKYEIGALFIFKLFLGELFWQIFFRTKSKKKALCFYVAVYKTTRVK